MIIALSIVIVMLGYVLSAGLAFALMYKIGNRFPSRIAGKLYAPLEWLSRKWPLFARFYNALCLLSYKSIVRGPLHNGWPPPPPTL